MVVRRRVATAAAVVAKHLHAVRGHAHEVLPLVQVRMKDVIDLALDVLQRLKPAVRRDEGDQREDHDAHEHSRQRAAPPRPLLRLHG